MNFLDFAAGSDDTDNPPRVTGGNDFASQYGSVADSIAERLGVSPRLVLAQLALETGYGKSIIPGTNNLGNIKDFSGGGVAATDNMTGSRDKYRSFDSLDDYADHHVGLMQRKYPGVIGAGDDADQFTRGLTDGGYAEDKNYGAKIKSIASKMGSPVRSSPTSFLDFAAGGDAEGGNPVASNQRDLSEIAKMARIPTWGEALTDAGKATVAEGGRLADTANQFGRALYGAAAGGLNKVGIVSDKTLGGIDDANVEAYRKIIHEEDTNPGYQATTTTGKVAQGITHMAPAIALGLANPLAGVAAFGLQGGFDAGKGAIDSGDSMLNAQLKAGGSALLNSTLGGMVAGKGNALLEVVPGVGKLFGPAAADTVGQIAARVGQGVVTMAVFKPLGTGIDYAADKLTGETKDAQGKDKEYDFVPNRVDLITGGLIVLPHSAVEYVARNKMPAAPMQLTDGSAALIHKNGSLFSGPDAAKSFIEANKIEGATVAPVTEASLYKGKTSNKELGYVVKLPGEIERAAPERDAAVQPGNRINPEAAIDAIGRAKNVDEAIAAANAAHATPVEGGGSALPMGKADQIRAVSGTDPLRQWMNTLAGNERTSVVGDLATGLSANGSEGARSDAIDRVHAKMADAGVFAAHEEAARAESLKGSDSDRGAIARAQELAADPTWIADHASAPDNVKRAVEAARAIAGDANVPEAYRAKVAQTILDYAESTRAKTAASAVEVPKTEQLAQHRSDIAAVTADPAWRAHLDTLTPDAKAALIDAASTASSPFRPIDTRLKAAQEVLEQGKVAGIDPVATRAANPEAAPEATVAPAAEAAPRTPPETIIAGQTFAPEHGKISVVDPAKMTGAAGTVSKGAARVVQLMGRALGKDVHFFTQEGHTARLDGFAPAGHPDAIFVNIGKGNAAWHYVAGHEFFHQMPEDIKAAFIESIKSEISPEQYKALVKYINQPELAEHGQWEEIAADLFGNRFGETAFWDRALGRIENPTVAQRLIGFIRDFVAKLQGSMGKAFETDGAFKDLQKVRDAANEALHKYMTREMAGEGTIGGRRAMDLTIQELAELSRTPGAVGEKARAETHRRSTYADQDAGDQLARAAGVETKSQPIARLDTAQPRDFEASSDLLSAQLKARRKQARGELLSNTERALAEGDTVQANPDATVTTDTRFTGERDDSKTANLIMVADRGDRVVGSRVTLSAGEKTAISAGAKAIGIAAREVEAVVRGHKMAHPRSQGWAPLEFSRAKLDDKGKPVYEYKKVPYDFSAKDGKQLSQGSPEYQRRVESVGKSMTEAVRSIFKRAEAGDKSAQNILAQAGWYKAMRTRLRQEFGGLGDLFADVLGGTSPNTPVRDNWTNAVDVLRRASRGDFDHLMPKWEQWATKIETQETSLRAWFNEKMASTTAPDGTVTPGMTKKAIKELPEYVAKIKALKEARELPDDLLPAKESGSKYGFNGRNVARGMVDLWRVVRDSDPDVGRGDTAPKAVNFSGNLIGFRPRATIDVWAARHLQRLAGGERIPSMAEMGVSGAMRGDGSTTLQFGFGQDAFGDATQRIRRDPEMRRNKDLENLNDDDLQAVVWFVEKEHWTINDWTNSAGEGGSFELEASLTGTSQQARVRDLRRIIDSSPPRADVEKANVDTTAARATIAQHTLDTADQLAQLQALRQDPNATKKSIKALEDATKVPPLASAILNGAERAQARLEEHARSKVAARAELATLEREVDRFVGGLSEEMSVDNQGTDYVPTNADMARLGADVTTSIYEGTDGLTVLASKALPTQGRYGAIERSLDLEIVAREGYDPTPVWRTMIEKAAASKQDSTFLSRVLRAGEDVDYLQHRPGVEIYFREAASREKLEDMLSMLAKENVEYLTVIVDGRRTSAAMDGEMPNAVGVRMQYVPEFEQRYGSDNFKGLTDAEISAKIEAKGIELLELAGHIAETVPGVSYAGQHWYDTQVAFSHQYGEKLNAIATRNTEGKSGSDGAEVWAGQRISAGIESANRQVRETSSGESNVADDVQRRDEGRPNDDAGSKLSTQREETATTIGQQFREMVGKNDDAFQYTRLVGDKDLSTSLKQTGIPFPVSALSGSDMKARDSADQQFRIKLPDGGSGYVYRFGKDIQLDISDATSGKSQGTAVYQAVSSWSHANGYRFEGDSAGISPEAKVRRTENMISTILRHETSDHIVPHPEQKSHMDIRWATGKTDQNLGELLIASYNKIKQVFPEIDDVRPTKHGDFERHGDLFAGDDFKALQDRYDTARTSAKAVGAGPAGISTLTRAAVVGELLRRQSDRAQSQLHDQLDGSRDGSGIGPEALTQALYSTERGDLSRAIETWVPPTKVRPDPLNKDLRRLTKVADSGEISSAEHQTMFHDAGRKFIDGVAKRFGDDALLQSLLPYDMRPDSKMFNTNSILSLNHELKLGLVSGPEEGTITLIHQVARRFAENAKRPTDLSSLLAQPSRKLVLDSARLISAWAEELGYRMPKIARDAPALPGRDGLALGFDGARGDTLMSTERVPKWAESLAPDVQDALRKAGVIYEEKTWKDKVTDLKTDIFKKMQYGILDQFAPIKDQLGKEAYMHARMAKASDGTLEAMMLYGKPVIDSDGGIRIDPSSKGFVETMKQLGGEHERFLSWMAGMRAKQLKTEGRENLFTDNDISSLSALNLGRMTDGKSREILYQNVRKEVSDMNNAVLDIAEKSGLIDPESRKVWASDFYVPFYRVMEEGISGPSIKSGLVNQKSIKMLKGGTNELNDLTKNMLTNWSTLLTSSAKNRAARASLDKAVQLGAAIEAGPTTIAQMSKSMGTKVVTYLDGGKPRHFTVDDPHLLAAISALEFNGYNNGAMKVMSQFKNYLTMAVTASPLFKVRNLIRDSVASIAVAETGYNPFANVKQGYQLLGDEHFKADMIAGGGVFRFGTMMDGDRGQYVKKLINTGVKADTILDTKAKMIAFTQKLWNGYKDVGDLSENVNRAALYQKLRNEGMSHMEASFEARDLMDFGLSGAWAGVRALNQVLPFFNARLQGVYKLGRGYNDDPQRMGYVIGAVAMASVSLMLAYKDDPDFQQRSESDRNNYWWFKVGGMAYRIPKPFEIGAFGSAIEHFTALFVDSKNTNAKRFSHQLGDIISGQLSMNPIPQLVRPMVDVYANKDAFSGRPIESAAMQALRPQDRYSNNTSEIARALGKVGLPDPLSLVGGQGYKPLSPVQIDSLVRGYFSGAGVLVTTSVDAVLQRTVVDRGASLPLTVKDFAGSFSESLPSNSSRYTDMLYQAAQRIEQTHASYQNAVKAGDTAKAQHILQSEGPDLAKYHMIENLKRSESKLTRELQRIRDSRTMSGADKQRAINELKQSQDRIARTFEG